MCVVAPASKKLSSLFWAVPILFALHNLEEGLFAQVFLESGKAPPIFRNLAVHYSTARFVLLLVAISVPPLIVAMRGDLTNPRSRASRFLILLQILVFTNAFWHATVGITLRSYVP